MKDVDISAGQAAQATVFGTADPQSAHLERKY
jgi:hypothetical protein